MRTWRGVNFIVFQGRKQYKKFRCVQAECKVRLERRKIYPEKHKLKVKIICSS